MEMVEGGGGISMRISGTEERTSVGSFSGLLATSLNISGKLDKAAAAVDKAALKVDFKSAAGLEHAGEIGRDMNLRCALQIAQTPPCTALSEGAVPCRRYKGEQVSLGDKV
jgi:hypothetical protein